MSITRRRLANGPEGRARFHFLWSRHIPEPPAIKGDHLDEFDALGLGRWSETDGVNNDRQFHTEAYALRHGSRGGRDRLDVVAAI